jgi:predicted NAD/FAD-dependent oxidoreductase
MVRTDYGSETLFDADGRRIGDRESESIDGRMSALRQRLHDEQSRRRDAGESDISVADAVRRLDAYGGLSGGGRRQLDWSINTSIEHEYGADVEDLSLLYYDDDLAFGGGDAVLPDGYDAIANGLARGIDVRLRHVVERISSTPTGVTIDTTLGSISADRAIVTLPLGVLKRRAVTFAPGLSDRSARALERLGSGVLNKVCMRFATAFWSEDDADLLGYVAPERGRWAESLNSYKCAGQPVLTLFNAGSFGTALEALSDQSVVASAMSVLRRMYGPGAADPIASRISRWHADPFAGGSYTFVAVGSTGADCDALAEPANCRLFFAGEATHRKYRGTVHGAYLSGLREATRLARG